MGLGNRGKTVRGALKGGVLKRRLKCGGEINGQHVERGGGS